MNYPRVLVVENEPDIAELLVYHLSREGFQVTASTDGFDALSKARREKPAVVLLDIMIPELDGLCVCEQIRREPTLADTRVIMISARVTEADVLSGLNLGADDYVRKPFRPKEVIARVRAVLRRSAEKPRAVDEEIVTLGPLALNPGRHQVTLEGERLNLTATEYRLLYALMSNAGRVFSRAQLLEQAGESTGNINGRSIDVHIRALRLKLGSHAELIGTARGVGYRMSESGTAGSVLAG